jgi:hypothetical protein
MMVAPALASCLAIAQPYPVESATPATKATWGSKKTALLAVRLQVENFSLAGVLYEKHAGNADIRANFGKLEHKENIWEKLLSQLWRDASPEQHRKLTGLFMWQKEMLK